MQDFVLEEVIAQDYVVTRLQVGSLRSFLRGYYVGFLLSDLLFFIYNNFLLSVALFLQIEKQRF
jgi:hypothetical protein